MLIFAFGTSKDLGVLDNRNKNMLALPGIFLPNNSTIAILSYKLLRMLDYDIDVLAMATEDDDSLKENIQSDPLYRKFTINLAGEYRYAIFERSNRNILKLALNKRKYYKQAVKSLKDKNYGVVFSLSVPNFSHMAGYKVKKKKKSIKWVASFSDPIKDNPMVEYNRKEYNSLAIKAGHFFMRKLNDRVKYQKVAFKHADLLVFVSEEQRDFMTQGKKELIEKSVIVPFTYIKEWPIYKKIIETQNNPGNKPKRIVHLGNVYGARRIDSLIEGIIITKKKIPDLYKHIIIEHYGNMEQRQKKLIEKNGVQDVFIAHERIPYSQTLDIMSKSDTLLLLDVYIDEDKLQPFMPSKFIEYLLANKTIISIANHKSPIYRHLKDTKHINVKPNGEDISKALIDIIEKDCSVKNNYEMYENKRVIRNTLIREFEKLER